MCGLSGGVDSSVAAMLVSRAIGDRLTCIFVDNGVLRKDEADEVVHTFRDHFSSQAHPRRRESRLPRRALAGVTDPEQKRKIIGRVFIEVFEREAKRIDGARFLVQGTLYPDVIESVSFKGPSAVIKSHHNVGGLPEKMHLKLVEPFRELFKDEVRAAGDVLGMPPSPFYGAIHSQVPGLAIRMPRRDHRRTGFASCERQTRSSSTSFIEPTCIRLFGRRSASSFRSRRWASWGTSAPTSTSLRSEPSTLVMA